MLIIKNNKLIVNGNRLGISKPKYNGPEILTYKSKPIREITGPCVLKFMVPTYWFASNSFHLETFSAIFYCDISTVESPIITIPNLFITGPSPDYIVSGDKTTMGYDFPFNLTILDRSPQLYEMSIEFFGPGQLQMNFPYEIQTAMDTWITPSIDSEYNITLEITELFLLKKELSTSSSCYVKYEGGDAQLFLGGDDYDFTPDINTQKYYTLLDGETVQIIDDITNLSMFFNFAKLKTTTPNGKLSFCQVGYIPDDKYTLLKHDEPIYLQANDNRVFCFPRTWQSTEFLTNTQYLMDMHVSNTSEFEIGDANVITKYAFSKEGSGRQLQLSTADISTLGASSSDDYVYVRFQCNSATTLTPSLWNVSSCVANTILVMSGQTFSVAKAASNEVNDVVYRLVYDDWKNYDFIMKWSKTQTLPIYFASFCSFRSTDSDILHNENVIKKKSVTIASSKIDSWVEHIEDDGFVFIRFKFASKESVKITSSKPVETDQEI